MIEYSLNILGGEWVIIIFVVLILFLGTGHLPGAARKLGKAVNEYNRAKADVQNQLKEVSHDRTDGLTDEQLQKMISDRMGQKKVDDPENQKPN
jgi:sec-independent protein translocase protein TatA